MSETTNTTTNNKTARKNRTNLVVNWPGADKHFTITDLQAANPDFINITLRVRLKKAVDEEAKVAVIGTKNLKKGRPQLVFAVRPVSQTVLDAAKADGVILEDQSRLVPVMQVTTDTQTSPTVEPTVEQSDAPVTVSEPTDPAVVN